MDGIINVRKEKGYTSFDVVAVLRGILKEKKIGHCGTLDPDAEGVLVVCAGQATKVVELLTAHEKTYRAKLLLGVTTDTQDTGGTILARGEVAVSKEDVRRAAASFTGEIDQIPPMYSAVKVNGKKLYELARAGKEAERKPRKVRIRAIDIEKIELPYVWMTVQCSKGTYIRTLCEDIGKALGCGGAMDSLVRIRSGAFSIEDSCTLAEIRQEMATAEDSCAGPYGGRPKLSFLHPLDACFSYLPSVAVSGQTDFLVRNGNPIRLARTHFQPAPEEAGRLWERGETPEEDMVRIYLADGTFAGVYQYQNERKLWKPWKMFLTAQQGKRT